MLDTDPTADRKEWFRRTAKALGLWLKLAAVRVSRFRSPLDARDFGQLAGLGLVFWGLWLREPWLAPLVTGACLYLTHLFGDYPTRRSR